ncbi:hypothetical protein [Hymenobacter sp.]|uniref:hypothetical protein n=1 Tax=Hymenobacter sp. TaxID=1898978 RepID=UPI002EDA8B9F
MLYVIGAPRHAEEGGLSLDPEGDLFLQFEEETWSEGFLDPHQSLILYLYQSNGWFKNPSRIQLWTGDSEVVGLTIKDIKFLPHDPTSERCLRIEVPRYINSGISPNAPPTISQNDNILTFCQ